MEASGHLMEGLAGTALQSCPYQRCPTENWLLPSAATRIESLELQLLTLNTPWKEFRVEIRNGAVCALGKTGRTDLWIVRYFSGDDFRSPNLCLFSYLETKENHSRKHLLLVTSSNLHETSSKTSAKMYLPFTKIIDNTDFLPTSSRKFLRPIWDAISQAIVLILPQ